MSEYIARPTDVDRCCTCVHNADSCRDGSMKERINRMKIPTLHLAYLNLGHSMVQINMESIVILYSQYGV